MHHGLRHGLIAVAGLLAVSTGALAEPMEDGQAAYNRGDFQEALRQWQPLADQGVARAQNNLGVLYENGKGVPANINQALKWYRAAAGQGYSTATDLADWLVREADVPFREAHHITGRAVKLAEERGCGLAELRLDDLKSIDDRIDQRVYDVLSVDASVRSRTSYGGTAPARVREQIAAAKDELGL